MKTLCCAALLFAMTLTADAQTSGADDGVPPDAIVPPPADFVVCPERADSGPVACTMEYAPVCGAIDNGVRCVTTPCESNDWQTFSNGCSACATAGVIGYRDGAC